MNKYQTLHETPVRAILDLITLAHDVEKKDIFDKAQRSPYASTSIARITNDMTLVFPVMVSSSLHIDTAIMISKAIERKCVSMLQILFSAFQVSDAKDAKDLLSRFHSNIKLSGKASVDDFIALGDALGESGRIKVDQSRIKLLSKDFRENCFFVLEHQNISPTSIATQYSGRTPLMEAKPTKNKAYQQARNANPNTLKSYQTKTGDTTYTYEPNSQAPEDQLLPYYVNDVDGTPLTTAGQVNARKDELDLQYKAGMIDKVTVDIANTAANTALTQKKTEELIANLDMRYPEAIKNYNSGQASAAEVEYLRHYIDLQAAIAAKGKGGLNDTILRKEKALAKKAEEELKRMRDPVEREKRQLELNKMRADIEKIRTGQAKDLSDIARNETDFFSKQILSGDIKKANELQPVTMVMSFKHLDSSSGRATSIENVVIGVKARLIPVDSADIINHIITKLDDHQFVFNLVRATTREISFMKDFVFAIDKAKIEALANSHRGSANPMWKVLERRAIMSRIKRTVGIAGNNANAITSLVLSQEEVDYIRNNYSRDMSSAREASVILDSYNFLSFVIADESLEVCKFLFDTGEAMWETLPFNALEREAQDNSYKKIVNLMSKVS